MCKVLSVLLHYCIDGRLQMYHAEANETAIAVI